MNNEKGYRIEAIPFYYDLFLHLFFFLAGKL